MDADDPVHRRRLLPLPRPRPPAVPSSSLRRLPNSLLLPPVHPTTAAAPRFVPGFGHYQPQTGGGGGAGGGGAGGSHHARALSQPQFMSMDFLFRPPYADLAAQAPIARSPAPPAPPPGVDKGASSGLPPLRAGHRRSQSEILLAVSTQPNLQMPPPAPVTAEALAAANNSTLDGILGAYMGPKNPATAASSGPGAAQERRDHQDSQVRAWSPADSSENEADSGDGGLPRHCRSLSADSFVGQQTLGATGLPPLSPGPGAAVGLARSGSGSIGGAAALFAKEFASLGFSESDKKKIIENEHLAKIVMTDPRKVKRILNNRLSAAKSKERKVRYMTELERKVQVLQSDTATLTSQVTMLQRGHSLLSTHNNELKIRLHALEQQAQLKDALNEALSSEVQRLKLVAGETSDPQMPNGSEQQMSTRMIQLHQLLKKPPKAQQDQQQKWS